MFYLTLFFLAVAQSPGLARSQAHSTAQEKKFDLLSDLGGDIFAAPPSHTSSSANFANFAHFPNQSGKFSISFWCRIKTFSSIYPSVCHHPVTLSWPLFYFYIHCMSWFPPLPCVTSAPQGNSNNDFANFEAFGNTAIPSHLSTSPHSKSFSSGTPNLFSSFLYLIHTQSPLSHIFLTYCVDQ